MTRHRNDLGARKHVRVEIQKSGFLIPAPDVSDSGVCLEVGAMAVPKVFGLSFTAGGEVMRVCALIWRRGELVGARFVSAKELRQGQGPNEPDPKPQTVLI